MGELSNNVKQLLRFRCRISSNIRKYSADFTTICHARARVGNRKRFQKSETNLFYFLIDSQILRFIVLYYAKSVPIATNVVNLDSTNGEVYSIQLCHQTAYYARLRKEKTLQQKSNRSQILDINVLYYTTICLC